MQFMLVIIWIMNRKLHAIFILYLLIWNTFAVNGKNKQLSFLRMISGLMNSMHIMCYSSAWKTKSTYEFSTELVSFSRYEE